MSASSLLEHVGLQLRNAEIDVNTLRILQKNRGSFLNLCSFLSDADGIKESTEKTEASKMSGVDKNQQHTTSAKLFLDMRIEELDAFEQERDAVRSFVDMCSIERAGKMR